MEACQALEFEPWEAPSDHLGFSTTTIKSRRSTRSGVLPGGRIREAAVSIGRHSFGHSSPFLTYLFRKIA